MYIYLFIVHVQVYWLVSQNTLLLWLLSLCSAIKTLRVRVILHRGHGGYLKDVHSKNFKFRFFICINVCMDVLEKLCI